MMTCQVSVFQVMCTCVNLEGNTMCNFTEEQYLTLIFLPFASRRQKSFILKETHHEMHSELFIQITLLRGKEEWLQGRSLLPFFVCAL